MVDTGPPYPPLPDAGSNGIGLFQIGVSQIGDIASFEWLDTVVSQYANSPILMGMIERYFDAADQTENLSNFYDDIWNVATATGYGLDVWGRIVGVSRILQIASPTWFGFNEAQPGSLSFNSNAVLVGGTWIETSANQGGGAFYSGTGLTTSYRLDDETYRRLILAKAAQNISDCSIPSINQFLLNLFPNRGNAYVTDGQIATYFGFYESQNAQPFNQQAFYNGEALSGMSISYIFDFPLSVVDIAILTQSGAVPRPSGVVANIVINITTPQTVIPLP